MEPNENGEAIQKNQRRMRDVYDWIEALISALVTVILIFTFCFRIVGVEGSSMVPTLHNGDRVIITDVAYTPQAGDIVVLNKPNLTSKPFIKRIIATQGQTVNIDYGSGTVIVDGQPLKEDYIKEPIAKHDDVVFPIVVPQNEIFVMGDNRNGSTDSRSTLIGTVDTRYIMGHAMIKIFPLTDIALMTKADRG